MKPKRKKKRISRTSLPRSIVRKSPRPVKLDAETHGFFKTLKREISEAENTDVSMGEIIRRGKNIPGFKNILIEDARFKRGRR